MENSAGLFKQSMGARNRIGIGLSYRPARLYAVAELIPWNRFLGSLKVKKFGLRDGSKGGSGSRWARETIREEGIIESRKAEGL